MTKGSEYEQFVFEKFERFFAGGKVTKNDHIKGHLSGIDREIDVSVRIASGDVDMLYIAQCKDWKTPVDIKVLGEFSSVIQDVRASKGFLLCTSGFAKSNHQYALTLGIELITIEDINSTKWKTTVQIPFLYIRKLSDLKVELQFTADEAFAELNRDRELLLTFTTVTPLTHDGGATSVGFQDYVDRRMGEIAGSLVIGSAQDIGRENLHIEMAGIWVPCTEFSVMLLDITKKHYLKYLTPDEYSHLRDHVRGTTLPLHFKLSHVGMAFDDTFVEVSGEQPPVISGLYLEVEEWTQTEIAMSAAASGRSG